MNIKDEDALRNAGCLKPVVAWENVEYTLSSKEAPCAIFDGHAQLAQDAPSRAVSLMLSKEVKMYETV